MATTTASEEKILHPPVKWAQRYDKIYLTIDVEDIDPKAAVTLDNSSLFFSGKAGHDHKKYEVRLNFHGEVDPTRSKELRTGREMFFSIYKSASNATYWPRLLKDRPKPHYLKVDFNRWKDEDDSDQSGDEGKDQDRSLEDMMRQMSSGTTGLPDMNDFKPPSDEDSDDSDDDELPDLEDTTDTKE